MSQLRIIFMGTSAFASPSLEALITNGYQVVAVVSAPDKPQGRGQKVLAPPIKQTAQTYNLPILQPESLKDRQFLEALASYRADLQVVVAFRMLPSVVWSMPRLGTINLHASLLPQYRGAAPINWAIINGEQETGVTTFFIEETLDTGNILLQRKEPIHPRDTFDTLSVRLQHKGAELLVQTVKRIQEGTAVASKQPAYAPDLLKKAPKLFKAGCQVDWHQNTEEIVNFIRGLSTHPGSWIMLQGQHTKLIMASPAAISGLKPGSVATDNKNYLYIGTQDGAIAVEVLQVAGKKQLDIRTFLRGNPLKV
jgi:methionyl-tRNA formyltransferase